MFRPRKLFIFGPAREGMPFEKEKKMESRNFGRERKIMLIRNCVLAGAFLWAAAGFAQSAVRSAHADIVNAQGQKIGPAAIRQAGAGIRLYLQVSQLPPGTHGIHIHSVGKCEGPDFISAGGHLNPNTEKTIPNVRTPETCATFR